uniref:DNA polymerase alpha subunit B n=1 Tax=Oryza meridionalis TaxID=40149 RepID=A0A0E0FAT1_9ORYZ
MTNIRKIRDTLCRDDFLTRRQDEGSKVNFFLPQTSRGILKPSSRPKPKITSLPLRRRLFLSPPESNPRLPGQTTVARDAAAMEEEIRAEFESSGFSIGGADPGAAAEILSTLLTYCINYKMSPADLVSNWEVYYLNRQLNGLKLESSYLDGFLSHLQNEVKDRIIKEETSLHIYSSNDVDMLLSSTHTDEEGFLDTPSTKQEKPNGESCNSELTPLTTDRPSSSRLAKTNGDRITPFSQRVNKFTQQYVLNSDNVASVPSKDEIESTEDEIIRRVQPNKRCILQVQRSQPEPGCRFMYDRIEDRFNYLEDRIRRSGSLFSASGLCGEPADATLASEESMFSVGMVICDGEGHLNEKSILLQGSVEHSRGQRVRLDLKDVDRFSLFPGQVVGIQGHNPSGHCFVVSKLNDSIPSFVDAQLPRAKKQAVDSEGNQSSDVVSRVLSSMGPFIDSDHPEIKKGAVDQSFQDIFLFEILRKLQDFTQYLGHNVRVILIPSVRDAHHDFVFPQPAFDLNLPEDITHQIHFGCCTMDILKHLSGEEISRKPPGEKHGDRIGRICTHILKQQSYYPLYPPPAGVPLDFSLANGALEIASAPDVLLLPSDLAPFVKGIGGGTFVELDYNGDTDKTSASLIRI